MTGPRGRPSRGRNSRRSNSWSWRSSVVVGAVPVAQRIAMIGAAGAGRLIVLRRRAGGLAERRGENESGERERRDEGFHGKNSAFGTIVPVVWSAPHPIGQRL